MRYGRCDRGGGDLLVGQSTIEVCRDYLTWHTNNTISKGGNNFPFNKSVKQGVLYRHSIVPNGSPGGELVGVGEGKKGGWNSTRII